MREAGAVVVAMAIPGWAKISLVLLTMDAPAKNGNSATLTLNLTITHLKVGATLRPRAI